MKVKSAVVKGGRYEGDINSDYERLAAHYGCAVMPARPLKPKCSLQNLEKNERELMNKRRYTPAVPIR